VLACARVHMHRDDKHRSRPGAGSKLGKEPARALPAPGLRWPPSVLRSRHVVRARSRQQACSVRASSRDIGTLHHSTNAGNVRAGRRACTGTGTRAGLPWALMRSSVCVCVCLSETPATRPPAPISHAGSSQHKADGSPRHRQRAPQVGYPRACRRSPARRAAVERASGFFRPTDRPPSSTSPLCSWDGVSERNDAFWNQKKCGQGIFSIQPGYVHLQVDIKKPAKKQIGAVLFPEETINLQFTPPHRRQTLARQAWRCPRGILVRMRAYALHRAPQLAPGCCVARRAALQRPRLC